MESFIGYLGVGKIENDLLDDTILMFNKMLVDDGNLHDVRLKKIFPSSLPIPASAYNHLIGKYVIEQFYSIGHQAISSVDSLKKGIRMDKVVLITSLPLFSHAFNCSVMGEAEFNGKVAVIGFDAMKHDDTGLVKTRICKELFHLLGLLYGLKACRNVGCVMNSCADVSELDAKGTVMCADCARKLKEIRQFS